MGRVRVHPGSGAWHGPCGPLSCLPAGCPAWHSRAPGKGCPAGPQGLAWLGLVPKEGQGPHQLHKCLQHLQVASVGRSTGQARHHSVPDSIGLLGGDNGTLGSSARLPPGA